MSRPFPHTVLLTTLLLCVCVCVQAQDADDYDPNVPPPGEKPDTARFFVDAPARKIASRYGRLELLDQRADTVNIGLISTNTYYDIRVVPGRPLREQLTALLPVVADSPAADRTLLVVLKRFACFDVSGRMGPRLCMALRFCFFEREGNECRQLPRFDTVLQEPYNIWKAKLSKRIFAATNTAITGAFERALSTLPDNRSPLYSYAEVLNFDSALRRRLPLYLRDSIANGVYLSYVSFATQQPDYPRAQVAFDGDQIIAVTPITTGQPLASLSSRQVYAVCWNGKAYISRNGEYYPLTRMGDDLCFTGKIRVGSGTADALVDVSAFAVWAVSMATFRALPLVQVFGLTAKKKFLMKLDYSDGSFAPVKPL